MNHRHKLLLPFALGSALASSAVGCNPESPAVAGNCTADQSCVDKSPQLLSVDKLDILLVVDNSASAHNELELFKSELPRMLTSFVNGEDADGGKFPPVQSVNLALLTSDMGVGTFQQVNQEVTAANSWRCSDHGEDGLFHVYSESDIRHCDPTRPSFLSFRGDAATLSAIDSVGCVPDLGDEGCGFEQPLEAILKSLVPADSDHEFNSGEGHGTGPHAGFLREDSLLVVIVVTDEDDCSISDPDAFFSKMQTDHVVSQFCVRGAEHLHPVARYTESLKSLRSTEDDIIFAVVAGIPPTLVAQQSQELGSQDAFFKTVLNDPALELQLNEQPEILEPAPPPPPGTPPGTPPPGTPMEPAAELPQPANVRTYYPVEPSCTNPDETRNAIPPRRLVEVAQSFGDNGVVGSICDDDFGSSVGNIMRTVAERLRAAAPTESAE